MPDFYHEPDEIASCQIEDLVPAGGFVAELTCYRSTIVQENCLLILARQTHTLEFGYCRHRRRKYPRCRRP